VSKTISHRQKPGWQRVRKAEAENQKGLFKRYQEPKKNSPARAKKG
jgi:hypothetical protein